MPKPAVLYEGYPHIKHIFGHPRVHAKRLVFVPKPAVLCELSGAETSCFICRASSYKTTGFGTRELTHNIWFSHQNQQFCVGCRVPKPAVLSEGLSVPKPSVLSEGHPYINRIVLAPESSRKTAGFRTKNSCFV